MTALGLRPRFARDRRRRRDGEAHGAARRARGGGARGRAGRRDAGADRRSGAPRDRGRRRRRAPARRGRVGGRDRRRPGVPLVRHRARAGRVRPLPAAGGPPRADLESPQRRRPAAARGSPRCSNRCAATHRGTPWAPGARCSSARGRSTQVDGFELEFAQELDRDGLLRPRRLDQLRRRPRAGSRAPSCSRASAELCPADETVELRLRLRGVRRTGRRPPDGPEPAAADRIPPRGDRRTEPGHRARARAGRARRRRVRDRHELAADPEPRFARSRWISATRCRRPGRCPGAGTRCSTSRCTSSTRTSTGRFMQTLAFSDALIGYAPAGLIGSGPARRRGPLRPALPVRLRARVLRRVPARPRARPRAAWRRSWPAPPSRSRRTGSSRTVTCR